MPDSLSRILPVVRLGDILGYVAQERSAREPIPSPAEPRIVQPGSRARDVTELRGGGRALRRNTAGVIPTSRWKAR